MPEALPDWQSMPADERLTMVKAMAKKGDTSTLIASRFQNATRMSVIGLCKRKKIQLKSKAPKPPAQPKRPKVEARIDVRQVSAARAKGPQINDDPDGLLDLGTDVTGLIGIMHLKVDSCRYMYGDPKGQHGYCGKTTKANSSWCPHHHDIVFGGKA